MTQTTELLCEVRGQVGFITLNRPKALNALSLGMVRGLLAQLLAWRDDPAVLAVAIRGSHKEGVFGHFCAGGDIRFLHQTVQAGSPQIEDFFTEEYTLNHVIFTYPKPYIAFMDGVVMGGGMGISQAKGDGFAGGQALAGQAQPFTHPPRATGQKVAAPHIGEQADQRLGHGQL